MQAADVVQAASNAPAVVGPVGKLGGKAPEGVPAPAVRLQRRGGQAELVPDLADPRAAFAASARASGSSARSRGELLVERQGFSRKSRWSGVRPSSRESHFSATWVYISSTALRAYAPLAARLGEAVPHLLQGGGGVSARLRWPGPP